MAGSECVEDRTMYSVGAIIVEGILFTYLKLFFKLQFA